MPTPQLNIPHVTGSQNNKETTINAGLDALDNAMNKVSVLTITGNRTLTASELRGAGIFELTGTPSDFTLTIPPSIDRTFIIANLTGASCLIKTSGSAEPAIVLATSTIGSLYSDGTDTKTVASGGGGGAVSVSVDGSLLLAETTGFNFLGGTVFDNSDGSVDIDLSGTGGTSTTQSVEAASRDIDNSDLIGGVILKASSGGAVVFTVPSGLTGIEPVTVIRIGAGAVSFAAESGVDILSANGDLTLSARYSAVTLIPDLNTDDTFYLIGDITT